VVLNDLLQPMNDCFVSFLSRNQNTKQMSPFYDFQGKAHMKVEIYHLSQNGLNRCRTTLPSSVSIPIYQNIQNPTLTLATILGFVKNPPESWLYMDLALATKWVLILIITLFFFRIVIWLCLLIYPLPPLKLHFFFILSSKDLKLNVHFNQPANPEISLC